MDKSRRGFFRRAGLVAAVPTVGVAKVIGVRPELPAPATFRNGDCLTAEALNEEFDKLRNMIVERT